MEISNKRHVIIYDNIFAALLSIELAASMRIFAIIYNFGDRSASKKSRKVRGDGIRKHCRKTGSFGQLLRHHQSEYRSGYASFFFLAFAAKQPILRSQSLK